MLEFDSVHEALESLGASVNAAESHGTLCALLIGNAGLDVWLSHNFDDLPHKGDVLAQERVELLRQLFKLTRDQLNQPELGLELLLPDDGDDFGVRLIALASWCQGFLYGVGVCGIADDDRLDEQSQECLSDLLEISKLSYDAQLTDEAEQQFVEISEHVRMAALILNESLNPVKPPSTVH